MASQAGGSPSTLPSGGRGRLKTRVLHGDVPSSEVAGMRKECLELRKKLDSLERANKASEKRCDKLVKELRGLRDQRSADERDLSLSRRSCESLKFERDELAAKLKALQKHCNKLEESLVKHAKKNGLVEENDELRAQCEELVRKMEASKQRAESASGEMMKYKREVRILTRALDDQRGSIDAVEAYDMAVLQELTEEQTQRIAELEETVAQTQGELSASRKEVKRLLGAHSELEGIVQVQRTSSANLEQSISRYSQQAKSRQLEMDALLEKVQELSIENEKLGQTLASKEEQLASQHVTLEQVEKKHASQHRKFEELQTVLRITEQRGAEERKNIRQLQDTVKELERSADQHRDELAAMKGKLRNHEKDKSTIMIRYREAADELMEVQAQLKRSEEKEREHERDRSQWESKIKQMNGNLQSVRKELQGTSNAVQEALEQRDEAIRAAAEATMKMEEMANNMTSIERKAKDNSEDRAAFQRTMLDQVRTVRHQLEKVDAERREASARADEMEKERDHLVVQVNVLTERLRRNNAGDVSQTGGNVSASTTPKKSASVSVLQSPGSGKTLTPSRWRPPVKEQGSPVSKPVHALKDGNASVSSLGTPPLRASTRTLMELAQRDMDDLLKSPTSVSSRSERT